ncbi:MAG: hypothetical protein ACTSW3_01665 [Promethearchaeota archaeon]
MRLGNLINEKYIYILQMINNYPGTQTSIAKSVNMHISNIQGIFRYFEQLCLIQILRFKGKRITKVLITKHGKEQLELFKKIILNQEKEVKNG